METTTPVGSRRLSGLDAAFMYVEREEIPINVAGVFIFDGPIPYEEFVANIESKLDLIPRYRQIAVAPQLNIAYPTWEDDPHFDIRRHIHRTRVKAPGAEPELQALTGSILSRVFDRSKPLWEIHVVDGLAEGRGCLILRFHHALADGIAATALVKVMFDATPQGSRTNREAPPREPEPPQEQSLKRVVTDAAYNTIDKLIGVEEHLLEFAAGLLTDRMRSGVLGAIGLLPELVTAVERLPFNKPCGGEREFCWMEIDIPTVQAVRAVAGGTMNDVVLTVLTRGIARYVELHGGTTNNRLIRVVCPVNIRQDSGESLGNRISFMPVVLPIDIKDPVQMLKAVACRVETMKRARAAEFISLVATWLGATPPPVQWAIWRGLPNVILPLPLLNLICTNVPVSRVPLYAVGRKLLACYPQVPIGYELGIGVAVASYNGKLYFGIVSSPQAAPDAARLRDFMNASFEELCAAAGVKHRTTEAAPAPKRRKPAGRRARPAARKASRRRPAEVATPVTPVRRRRARAGAAAPPPEAPVEIATEPPVVAQAESEPEVQVAPAAKAAAQPRRRRRAAETPSSEAIPEVPSGRPAAVEAEAPPEPVLAPPETIVEPAPAIATRTRRRARRAVTSDAPSEATPEQTAAPVSPVAELQAEPVAAGAKAGA